MWTGRCNWLALRATKSFSVWRAEQTASIRNVANSQGRPVQLDGLQAYEIVADAADAKTGTAMKLYQVIAQEGEGFFIVQGLVIAGRAPAILPEFKRVTATFRRSPGRD